MPRGYFGVGIYQPKHSVNIGTLWRTAFSMGAAFIFTIGKRTKFQASDVPKSYRHLPMFRYTSMDDFIKCGVPRECQLVGIELHPKARSLTNFIHPERAIYILGAEDHGLHEEIINKCNALIQLPGKVCINVAVAGSIVVTDRVLKGETK